MEPLAPLRRGRSFTRRFLPIRNLVVALLLAAGIALVMPAGAQVGTGSTYGPVKQDDTLWELALRFRGEANATAHQVMIAILRANPEAFREGNINALRTGVTLRVPSAAEMTAITQGQAIAEFNRHEVAWRNRRRTGTAAPDPGAAPARPAQPAPAPARGADETAELEAQLRATRTEVTELNKRLAERDDAIEELLVQLAAVRRELRRAQGDTPAPPVRPAGSDGGGEGDGAARATWLPVSPLVLGSSLIVLLVLIVVVTLIRQRGGEHEEPYPEDEGEEELYELEPDEVEDETLHDDRDIERGSEAGDPEPARTGARPASLAAAAVEVAGDFESGRGDDDDPERDDLPIGMDLEEEDDWEPGPDEPPGDQSAPVHADDPLRFGRHVEVGELDELELEDGPDRASFVEVSEDLDDDESPADGERRG